MPDFTAHRHPVLAVRCPICGKAPGLWCCRPSGHIASDLHAARRAEAARGSSSSTAPPPRSSTPRPAG